VVRFDFQFKAMGSPCTLHFYTESDESAEHIYKSCRQESIRLEHKYSRFRPDSVLSQINRLAGRAVAIDKETAALLNYADIAYEMSDGLFDITSGALSEIWNFSQAKVPSKREIKQQKLLVGWDKVKWCDKEITLPIIGSQIDFGGIVKEYAADALATILKKHNVTSGLVDMGGDIHVIGSLPDGSSWKVGISDPAKPEQAIAKIPMMSGGLASSGDYQRYFTYQDKRYSHILNPKTGWPVTGLAAVSVWNEHCVIAGTLATIAMLKGERGIDWLQELGVPFVAITTDNHEVIIGELNQ
jgi:thiamine biosynthesis lipoprotein